MKKIISNVYIALIAMAFIFSNCSKDNPKPTAPVPVLTFSTPTSLSCSGECTNVATSSIPTGGAITYAINNVSVATVNSTTGAITPVAAGTAIVTATQAALPGINLEGSASYTLTISGLSITSFDPLFGGVGYTVTIKGTNFDGVTAANNIVSINGVQTATPTEISTTSLTVLVPKGAHGPGNITVTVGANTATKGTFTEYATVTTLAGDGTQSYKDGTGIGAQIFEPRGLAIDNAGNLLVVDFGNNRIRSITLPGGVVTAIAGDGGYDYLDGDGISAELDQPWGIAVNKTTGTIYVTDRSDNHIRTINSSGYVGTLAGSTEGNDDGSNLSDVQFYQPQGIAIDAFDNLYITDRWNSLIREIISPSSGTGYVQTLAGDNTSDYVNGNGTNTSFYFPDGLAISPDGNNLFIADHTNNCIRKLTIQGTVDASTFAGSSEADNGAGGNLDGTGTAARFAGPSGIAVDADGNLYVADTNNDLIRKITPAGVVTTIAGSQTTESDQYKDGLGPFAKIFNPYGIAVDADGTIYVSDDTNRVRKIVP